MLLLLIFLTLFCPAFSTAVIVRDDDDDDDNDVLCLLLMMVTMMTVESVYLSLSVLLCNVQEVPGSRRHPAAVS